MTRLLLGAALLLIASYAQADTLRLAVTTSFHNSGLSDVLLPAIKADTGLDVRLLIFGTGQALRLGKAGDVDALIVHARTAEEAFIAEGAGTHRTEIMYNDFVILGPSSDPAGIAKAFTAQAAFARIRQAKTPFISRGDESGTHQKEKEIWQSLASEPDDFGPWYLSVGASMGSSLNTAAALNAYILTDRASWLNFGNPGELTVLFDGDPVLFNQYSFLPVNPDRHPHVKRQAVQQLEAWFVSDRAQTLIDGYQINGQPVFTFNAKDTEP
ncbi:MAG: substrate-binding domain-containing protein [Pseudomonadota bacterium]